jgi:membrane-associated phospholipid phosphatase
MSYKSLVLFFVFVCVIRPNSASAQNLDIEILRSINVGRSQRLDPAFKFVSKTATPVSLGLPLTYLVLGGLNKNKAQFNLGWKTGITIASAMTISTILKYVINRPRPYEKYDDIQALSSDFTPSFPSGHTTSAFCTATTLSLLYPKWYVIVPSYAWASMVAYSRLHMGMHYPLDVLGGVIIGMGTSYLCYRLMNKYK